MQLVLRRDQKKALVGGGVIFTLDIRTEISEQEKDCIGRYQMGSTVLYEKRHELQGGSGFLGAVSEWFYRSKEFSLNINDLVRGKHIECKDVVELLETEEQIKQACDTFKRILLAALNFGGEEVIDL